MIRKKLLLAGFLSLALAVSVFSQSDRNIILTGLEVVPNVHTPATGAGEAWIESDTLYVRLEFENLKAPYYAGNIHFGKEDENGNPIFKLHPTLSEDHRSGFFDSDKNKFALSDAMKEGFKNGNLYINIASERHQRGEIRGQIDAF